MVSDTLWGRFKKWAFKEPITTATLPLASQGQVAVQVPTSQPGTGALIDTRTPEEQESDVHFGELVSTAAPVNWPTRTADAWRKFVAFNQNGCSACVAFSMAKILGVLRFLKDGTFVTFSMADIYTRRTTAGDGMASADVFSIVGQGVTLDALMPSQNLTDPQINALKRTEIAGEVAALFRLGGSQAIVAPVRDIDAIASIIQTTGKPVMVWYYFTAAEWGILNGVSGDYNIPAVLAPTLTVGDDAHGALRHSVAAVDFTLDSTGRKCLVIEDSAWFGNYNRRLITEDFHKTRNWFAGYPMNFATIKTTVGQDLSVFAPFNQTLQFIPWNAATNAPADPVLNAAQAPSVTKLQQILQILTDSRGVTYFPLNVECTGYYGATTAAGVYRWQTDNQVAVQSVLDSLQGKSFGAASVAFANKLIKG